MGVGLQFRGNFHRGHCFVATKRVEGESLRVFASREIINVSKKEARKGRTKNLSRHNIIVTARQFFFPRNDYSTNFILIMDDLYDEYVFYNVEPIQCHTDRLAIDLETILAMMEATLMPNQDRTTMAPMLMSTSRMMLQERIRRRMICNLWKLKVGASIHTTHSSLLTS